MVMIEMIEIRQILDERSGKRALGIKINLPEAPMLIILGDKGYLMCGYLNIEAVNKLGGTAAVISGVKTFEEMLEKEVKAASEKAKEIGIKEGMLGKEALSLLM